MTRVLVVIAASWMLAGCGHQMTLTYICEPAGAVLFENGQYLGRCPGSYIYVVTDQHRVEGAVRTPPLMARWPSGASASVTGITVPLARGYAQNFTFVRPTDVAGAELDYQVGANVSAEIAAQQYQAGHDLGYAIGAALAE